LALQADFSLIGQSGIDALSEVARERSLPFSITVDHGTEFTSKAIDDWYYLRGVKFNLIRPRKPPKTESLSRLMDDSVMRVGR